MKKIKIIIQMFFIVIFLVSCQSTKNVLTGKQPQSKGEEFLVEKKNPLVVPPDFDELPIPDQDINSTKIPVENESDFEKLLKEGNNQATNNKSNSSNTTEESILKKIKKNSDNK